MTSKAKFLIAALTGVFSLTGLVVVQFKILSRDVALKNEQISYAIPSILMDVHDRWFYNQSLQKIFADFTGTHEFTLTDTSDPEAALEREIHRELNKTLGHNYPDLEYELNVFLSSEYSCLIHSHHNAHLPRPNTILDSQNHICMCGLGNNLTFDISFNANNLSEVAFTSAFQMMLLTLLLVGLASGAFFFMIFTINRQKKLGQLKNDFINNLTHEFKTPIFSISLAANALRDEKVRKDSQRFMRYIGLIESEGKRLKTQVDKILQMALIDSGNFSIDRKLINIHDLIEKVVDHFRLLIEERKGQLRLQLGSENPVLNGDETHLRNIIFNLLDNALKYTDDQPEISIITTDGDKGLEISVRDNGIGMDEEVQKFIFDRFYRAPTGNIHNVRGFGLGLSYVKSIVDAHKGWIKLKSAIKGGSEFTIYLPNT